MGRLLFIVNPLSGGQAGHRVLQMLRKNQNADDVRVLQAVDLAETVRAAAGRVQAIIACGGDGTVASVLEAGHKQEVQVPVGVIPLGTGNDLARSFGWPGSWGGESRLPELIRRLETARPHPLDRWLLDGPNGRSAWYNYCSWGYDARVAGRFHQLRRMHQPLFRWRLANLACYAGIGMQEPGVALSDCLSADLPRPVPAWARSLVVANITTYGGGRKLADDIASDDRQCDCFALGSGVAFGLGVSGLRRPHRLGRHQSLSLRLQRPLFMQLDGEASLAQAGQYRICHGGQVSVLENVSGS